MTPLFKGCSGPCTMPGKCTLTCKKTFKNCYFFTSYLFWFFHNYPSVHGILFSQEYPSFSFSLGASILTAVCSLCPSTQTGRHRFLMYEEIFSIKADKFKLIKWNLNGLFVCVLQSLLRSPEVISFLQQQQQLLATQGRSQTQQQFQGCWRRLVSVFVMNKRKTETVNIHFPS